MSISNSMLFGGQAEESSSNTVGQTGVSVVRLGFRYLIECSLEIRLEFLSNTYSTYDTSRVFCLRVGRQPLGFACKSRGFFRRAAALFTSKIFKLKSEDHR